VGRSSKVLIAVGVLLLWLMAVVGFGVPAVQAQSSQSSAPESLSAGSWSMELLTGGDERRAAAEAALASPEAAAERARSRTEYEGLKAAEAVSLAEGKFGIQLSSWPGPNDSSGAHIERYIGEDGAREVLPSGQHVLVQSSVPLRSAVGSGQLAPLSLSLHEEDNAYAPVNPLVPVSIAKQASAGVSLPYGISIAPVQADASQASRVVGNRVVYPATAPDTDYMVQPIAEGGVEASWQLLSQASPEENALRFDLPTGMTLQMSSRVPGQAEVVAEGSTALIIEPATAVEADGATLPVTYSTNGDVLTTHVDLSGSIDFPVMVDPIALGSYGEYGAGSWAGWKFAESSCGCFGSGEASSELATWASSGKENEWGEWYIYAPGAGEPGGALITRAWLDDFQHGIDWQSNGEAFIAEDSGSKPSYTTDGYNPADTQPAPYVKPETVSEDLEFCAQEVGGGYEGGPNPLCNESYGGRAFVIADVLYPGVTDTNYVVIDGAIMYYLDETPPSEVTLEDLPSGWTRYGPSPTWIHAKDAGTGIAAFKVEIPPGHLNEKGQPFFAQENACSSNDGFTGCPHEMYSNAVSFSELPTGAYTLGVYAYDATGNVREESPDPHLYVDHTPPKIESLTGSLVENASKIGAGDYTLNFDAVDGSESAPQSGVHTITVSVDGTKADEVTTSCPDPLAVPTSNCFGLSGSWTMEGERYGAGPHTVTVTAKDWAGNEASETLHITSDEASYASLGPGSVNLQTGDFKLGGADVSVGGAGASLTLSRSYESRNLNTGASGPLGPQWSLSVPDGAADGVWQSLNVEPSGNVAATVVNGARLSFVRSGGSFSSPAGYQTETLSSSPVEKPTEYRLTNAAGDQTIFKHAEHEEEGHYSPVGIVQAVGAGGLNKVTDLFEKTSEGITRPKEVLAPPPAVGVNCEAELVKGCRALTFNYAESTTATGEGREEWGDYKGRLTRVYLHAWNPKAGEKGEMTTTTIAEYAYDTQGRLRAEWNPQVSPALKTTYGYDAEGHVTAMTAPGQETWALTYGTTSTDSNAGRLLKALQAPASAGLWKGEAVASTEAPGLSGSPVVGVRMGVSTGKWSGSPVAYAYRWEDCNSAGGECSTIAGADNANYMPTSGDVGHSLVAQVIATNGSGSTVASSSPSAEVLAPGEAFSAYKLSSSFECPHDAAMGPDGNVWFTDSCDHEVGKITPTGEATGYSLPSGVCLGGITVGPDQNMWAAEECTNRLARITTKGEITEYSLPSGSHPVQLVTGPGGYLWFTEYGTSKIGKFNTTTDKVEAEYSLLAYSDPYGITVGSDGNVWFTEWGPGKIGKITSSGEVTEYGIGALKYPLQITSGPDKNLWFTEEGASAIGKITTGGSVTEYKLPSSSEPTSIAAGPEGNLRFTETKTSKIGEITTSGAIGEYTLPSSSYPMSIVTASDGNHLWFTEEGSNQIGEISTGVLGSYKLSSPFQCPHYTTQGPDGNEWFTDNCDHQVGKITPGGISTPYNFPSGVELAGITAGPDSNMWAAEEGANKIAKITTGGTISEYTLSSGSEPRSIVTGADKNLWVTEYGTNNVAKFSTSTDKTEAEYSLPSGSTPSGIAAGPEESLWVAETGTSKIAKVTTSGSISEHSLPSGAKPAGIVEGSDGNLWITLEGTNKIAKMTPGGTVSEYSLPSGSKPAGIASGADGNLWVTLEGTSKVARITTGGTLTEYALPSGSKPIGIATGPAGQLWLADNGSNYIGTITPPASTTEAEAASPQPGWTVEYNTPVAGPVAPNEMGSGEVAKWAQKDNPVSATAILPPDKPQGWPASSYQHATVYYLDGQQRTVNLASPAGGISTTEYNTSNDNVERTLSADNRAAALKEGSKSAEVAEHLSTESKYNSAGTELTSTLGPEHKIKLAGSSEEVLARKHTAYSYNEGAPEEGGPYYLVTKTTETARLANGEEKNQRTVTDSYSGQEGLGWKLNQATSMTTDPASVNQTRLNVYNKETGSIIETRAPGGNAETVSPPEPSETFGSLGSGNGQLNEPEAVAFGSEGDAWVIDQNNNRVERFTSSGSFVASYGSAGKGPGEYENAWGIAINQKTGNVYVADTENNRIQELNDEGTFIREWGEPGTGETQFDDPDAVTIDTAGHVWVANWEDDKVQEFSETGSFIRAFGAKGTGNGDFEHPTGLVFSQGMLYVVDHGNKRIEQFSTSGTNVEYTSQFGTAGKAAGQFEEPWGIAALPVSGNLFVSDEGNDTVLEFSPAGRYLLQAGWWGSGSNEFKKPTGIAVNTAGSLYVADQENNRISVWKQPEAGGAHMTYSTQFGAAGKGEGQFEWATAPATDSHGDVWVTDYATDHLQEFSSQGRFLASYGGEGNGNGQFYGMTGIAINQATNNMYLGDCSNHRIQELGPKGEFIRAMTSAHLSCPGAVALDSSGDVWVVDMTGDEVEEFSPTGSFLHAYGSKGSGNLQFEEPIGIAVVGSTVYVADTKNNRIEEISTSGAYVGQFSKEGVDGGQLARPEGIAANQAGDIFVLDSSNNRIEEFSPTGHYMQTIGEYGTGENQLRHPQGMTVTAAGDIYVADAENHRVQKWAPDDQAVHDSRTVYYSSSVNSEHPGCGGHAEWANLPCRTEPMAQPETEGLPELPVTSYTYNLYDEPEVTTSSSGGSTRTETDTYDAAGRLTAKEITASVGASMPKVTYQYNNETGALEKQTAEGHSITSNYNTLGQLASYTDAAEGTTTYKYDIDGRTTEEDTPFGSQTFSYNETTGLETKLVDSAAGTFKAAYDQEGYITSETLPNGLTACYTRNAEGEATGLEYRKSTGCESGSTWFSDTTTPTSHGQWASQTSSLSSETYAYDEAGRLTEVQETPSGKGCTARLYAYDEEGNRTSLTTRQPGSEGKCATEGGTAERHTYDSADRLTDEGVAYSPFGDITSLPASDAGGSTLESAYYADGQAAEQRQEGVTLGYHLDPARRTSEITTTSSKGSTVLIDHYTSEGATPAWTSETGGKWTRYIYGINNGLAAIQTDAERPVLQISNLHGDIIGTAADEESASKLLSSTNTTEYGVPTIGSPARYSWLGTQELPTEFPSGVIAMGARSYVPQIGRFLQPDPRPGGSENAYTYTHGNPLNETDPSGEWSLNQTSGGLSAVGTGEGEQLAGGIGIAAGAIIPAPVNAQLEAAFSASPPWDQETAGNEEYEEYEEEEGGEEYVSSHMEENSQSEGLIERLGFGQALEGEESEGLFMMVKGGPGVGCMVSHHCKTKHPSPKPQKRAKKEKCAPPNFTGIAYCPKPPGAEEPPQTGEPSNPQDPGGPEPDPGWVGDPVPAFP
jgi:RHS repeat-associated protein